ncbi:hypothetical protein CALVIDRAFT_568955 [Calocera viscosa TUFC12733]|uniref:Zn(2)-C6 fungal-type domain-containing protein n=1 Tax=Calocera viscosa (strain TUFC12733) TaxID=1330018 RepID=A0A167GGL3_CALVF|nr:hypothetical protein CALVIDRAFT_568955 [Calocera viscosa TUFC12733]
MVGRAGIRNRPKGFRVQTQDHYRDMPSGTRPNTRVVRQFSYVSWRAHNGVRCRLDTGPGRCDTCIRQGRPICSREFQQVCWHCKATKVKCTYGVLGGAMKNGGRDGPGAMAMMANFLTDWRLCSDEVLGAQTGNIAPEYGKDDWRQSAPAMDFDASLSLTPYQDSMPPPRAADFPRGYFEPVIEIRDERSRTSAWQGPPPPPGRPTAAPEPRSGGSTCESTPLFLPPSPPGLVRPLVQRRAPPILSPPPLVRPPNQRRPPPPHEGSPEVGDPPRPRRDQPRPRPTNNPQTDRYARPPSAAQPNAEAGPSRPTVTQRHGWNVLISDPESEEHEDSDEEVDQLDPNNEYARDLGRATRNSIKDRGRTRR